jgi:hypothetical protein
MLQVLKNKCNIVISAISILIMQNKVQISLIFLQLNYVR